MKIAIQGIKGSFHHIVAEQYFGENIGLIECFSFSEIPDILHNNKADVAVIAIENSIAGALLSNYALISDHKLTICGEYYFTIHHYLMALKGQTIHDIKEVYSHPMALLQCRKFFKDYPNIRLIEDRDTAYAAKKIRDNRWKGIGAIASNNAAKAYDLNILASEIQTIKNNITRFFVITNTENKRSVSADKASIKFVTRHNSGSLAKVLVVFAHYDLNLTKIQSLPIIETPWKYAFFADFIFKSYGNYYDALKEVEEMVESLEVLGEYQNKVE